MPSQRFCFLACFTLGAVALAQPSMATDFAVRDGQFVLNGKPFQILSGEMHYPRIPRAHWRDSFRMAKAMGLNTITTYTFWNVHEPRPGVYDFSGNNDVAEFVREAREEGLYVILRPGPYVCAEWEFGGFPAWLLKDRSLVVRSRDPKFLEKAASWLNRLGQELAPLQIGNGGNIILVQVENEYGSFGDDHAYLDQIRRMIVDAGFTKSQLYTADIAEKVADGSFPDLPVGINFGTAEGQAQKSFALLKQTRPQGPFLTSEFWDGWFDQWGGKHAGTNHPKEAANLDWILRQGYSVSLYMFQGGTNFGWMNGADSAAGYEPDVTSYDYDAPLDESGRPSAKYAHLRNVIAAATGVTPPAIPPVAGTIELPARRLDEAVSLWDVLPSPVHSEAVLSMEDLDQAYGYILYRKILPGPAEGTLELDELHDYAQVYLDGKLVGKLDRRLSQGSLPLKLSGAGQRLDILVENTGRINYGKALLGERKGITRQVRFAGQVLLGWDIYPLPMADVAKLPFAHTSCEGACFYRATIPVDAPADTFLDTRALTKGMVWWNAAPLGRFWNVGPQKTLYVPGPWMHQGDNEIVVFDLDGRPGRSLLALGHPILSSPWNLFKARTGEFFWSVMIKLPPVARPWSLLLLTLLLLFTAAMLAMRFLSGRRTAPRIPPAAKPSGI